MKLKYIVPKTIAMVALFSFIAAYADIDAFDAKEFIDDNHYLLPYRIHIPEQEQTEGLADTSPMPLVLFFHGAGQRGEDNTQQFKHGLNDLYQYTRKNEIPAIIIAPQCPKEQQWVNTPWGELSHSMPQEPSQSMHAVIELLEHIVSRYLVDTDRIYVIGLSMGGYGAWDIIQRHPERFAAAIPVCGGGDPQYADAIKDIAIWAFHGDRDGSVPTQRSRDMIAAIKQAGGTPEYTEYKDTTHNAWTPAMSSPETFDWLFAQQKDTMIDRVHKMTFSHGAEHWDHAMPTGNGQVGAMVYGNVENETVILTHDALLIRSEKPVLPNVSEHLPQTRQMIAAGQYDAARDFFGQQIAAGYDYRGPDSFHPAFNLMVDMETEVEITDQHREVNFETGEITVAWKQAGVDYERKLFVSREDDVLVLRIRASQPDAVNCRIGLLPLGLERGELGDGMNVRVPRFPSDPYKPKIKLEEVPITFNLSASQNELTLLGTYDTGGSYHMIGGEYGGFAKVYVNGGKGTTKDLTAVAHGANEVLVLCKLFANENAASALQRIQNAVESLPSDYDRLLSRHAALHRELFLRASLDLGADEALRALTNEELIQHVQGGSGRNAMIERLFDFGRYVLICSSRPGSMPTNLQGIWNGYYAPAWASDYHNDINIQMAYFQALPGNMAEVALPYFDYYEASMDDFRTNARNIYGCRGILAPISQTTHGLLYRTGFEHWTAGAGWLAQLFYEYWLYTGDTDFLRQRAVPFMKEVALFYEDFLFECADGRYIFSPSYSPENSPGNIRRNYTVNATMDIAVTRELLSNLCTACELLGIEEQGIRRWREMLLKLPDYMINQDGALKEWAHPGLEDHYNHRHLSHLYPLFPGFEITQENNPELVQACRIAVDERMRTPGTEPGWSFPLMASIYARLEDAPGAMNALHRIVPDYLWPNLFMLMEKQRPILQFDASSGVTSAVLEMLVFSTPEMIKLLPALPESWPAGNVKGIQTRAGIEVAMQWAIDDKQMSVELLSRTERQVVLKFPTSPVTIEMEPADAHVEASPYGDAYRLLTMPAGRHVQLHVRLTE